MGIKFDILSNMYILLEDSPFSQFFISDSPIKKIHRELGVSHDANLELLDTEDRNAFIAELQKGNAIFAIRNNIEKHEKATEKLKNVLNTLPQATTNRSRSFNELRDKIKILLKSSFNEDNKNILYKKFKRTAEQIKQLVADIYSNNPDINKSINETIDEFINTFLPYEFILIKRQTDDNNIEIVSLLNPDERKFQLPQAGRRIRNQYYTIWTFDRVGLIDTQKYMGSPIPLFNKLFAGWSQGKRKIFVIQNKEFLQSKKHPFEKMLKEKYSHILVLTTPNIQKFVNNVINTTQQIIANKIKSSVEPLKRNALEEIENIDKSDSDFQQSVMSGKSNIFEYRAILRIIKYGIKSLDPVAMFNEFILNDHKTDIRNYDLLPTPATNYYSKMQSPYDTSDPLSNEPPRNTTISPEKQKELNETGYHAITKSARQNNWNTYNANADTNWKPLPVDESWAIAFKRDSNVDEYRDFKRKFIIYSIKRWSRNEDAIEIENILNMI